MTVDFSKLNEEQTQVDGNAGGGGFVVTPPVEGVALLRLREVLEFGTAADEYKGKPKTTHPVSVVFELVHPRHAIRKKAEGDPDEGPFTGDFVRNHELTVRLNKSNSDKSKYMKLFNLLNYDGRVAVPKGKIPSFAPFIGAAFLGDINHRKSEDGKKTYVNLDKDGVYNIGAPRVPETDQLGAPTGNFSDVPVPEMQGNVRCFLWETGVDDDTYRAMWESIAIVGEKDDGTPFKNWIQEAISGEENTGWEGSRAQTLFGADAAKLAQLEEAMTAEGEQPPADAADVEAVQAETETPPNEGSAAAPVADPLEGLV